MTERLRELERAHAADPQDLITLRALADERRRRGLELLPDVTRPVCLLGAPAFLFPVLRIRRGETLYTNGRPVYAQALIVEEGGAIDFGSPPV